MNAVCIFFLSHGVMMLQAIVVNPEILISVMHKTVPLGTTLCIERDFIVVGHFTRDLMIVYHLVR